MQLSLFLIIDIFLKFLEVFLRYILGYILGYFEDVFLELFLKYILKYFQSLKIFILFFNPSTSPSSLYFFLSFFLLCPFPHSSSFSSLSSSSPPSPCLFSSHLFPPFLSAPPPFPSLSFFPLLDLVEVRSRLVVTTSWPSHRKGKGRVGWGRKGEGKGEERRKMRKKEEEEKRGKRRGW